jgi:hypothetical protein
MEELINFLQENDVEITDELKSEIKNIWNENIPKTDDLFTQEDVNKIVEKRLARAESSYQTEIDELKTAMEDMIDPEKVEAYETKISELEEAATEREKELKTDYELQLSAKEAGVSDLDYFEFLVTKKGMRDRLKLDEEGNVVATDKEGNILTEDGKKLGASALVKELAEEKPDIIGEQKKGKDIGGGGGNPGGSGPKDKMKNTQSLAQQLGYKSKKESE